MTAPRFWMDEQGGELAIAVIGYLRGDPLSDEDIALIRDYLRQWIAGDWGHGPELEELRDDVNRLTSRGKISMWIHKALDAGIDPL